MTHEERDNPPFFLYLFGGAMFNFITCIVLLVVIILGNQDISHFHLFVVSLYFGVKDWFMPGSYSLDGVKFRSMKKSLTQRQLFYEQSRIQEWLSNGHRLSMYDMSNVRSFDFEPYDSNQVILSELLSVYEALHGNYEEAYIRHMGMYYRILEIDKIAVRAVELNHVLMMFLGNQSLPIRKPKRRRRVELDDLIYEYVENGYVSSKTYQKFVKRLKKYPYQGYAEDQLDLLDKLLIRE